MPISSVDIVTDTYVGTGTAGQEFAVPFFTAGERQVEVRLDNVVVSPDDYTFERNADGTGTVTANLSGDVVIISKPDFRQQVEFQRFGPNYFDDINTPIDQLGARAIYLNARLDAAVRAPIGENLDELPFAADRAEKFIGFDIDGAVALYSIAQVLSDIGTTIHDDGTWTVTGTTYEDGAWG